MILAKALRKCAENLKGRRSASDGVEHHSNAMIKTLECVRELQMWAPPTESDSENAVRALKGLVWASVGVARASMRI